jgi:V/A-type H+-transporting ATPase subunit E
MSIKTFGITELISQIQQEGISKIKEERENIISSANEYANKIINNAEVKVKELYNTCEIECKQKKEDLNCELKMATRDFLLIFSKKIKTFIIRPAIKKQISNAINDIKFLKNCLKTIFKNILQDQNKNILIILNSSIKNDIIEFFSNDIFKDTLHKNNIDFTFTNDCEGFQIVKKNDNLIWDFTIDTLTQEIAKIVEPSLLKYFI